MLVKIFYSWQSDFEKKYNRNFIENCIEKAVKELKSEMNVFVEWNVDRDTKGEFGTIDIVQTIFKKIDETQIFIGDITLINSNSERRTPNPNVLTELGYAAAKIGWKNIITVFNESCGAIESLPFDLKFRRPVIYKYDKNTIPEDATKLKKEFIKLLRESIKRANPETVAQMESLNLEFNQESRESIRLINNKPNFWKERLICELLRFNMDKLIVKKNEINQKLILQKIKKITSEEFNAYCLSLLSNLMNLDEIFKKSIQKLNLGYTNDIEMSKSIRSNIKRLCNICEKIMDWEIELLSFKEPDFLSNLKSIFLLSHEHFFDALEQLQSNLTKYIYDNGSSKLIKIKSPTTNNTKQIIAELERIKEIVIKGDHI